MEERTLEERLVAVRGFFDDAVWKSMGAVERTRRANIFDNFRIKQGHGLTEKKPDFVVDFEKRMEAVRLQEGAKLAGGDQKTKAAADCAVADEQSPTERVACLVDHGQAAADDAVPPPAASAPRPTRAGRRAADVDVVEAPVRQRIPKRSREGGGRRAEYIYCYGCKKHVTGGCRKHKMTFVPDQSGVEQGTDNYARRSCPDVVSVAKRLVAGRGVWADQCIPAGHCFGPFKGVVMKRESDSSEDYTWSVGRGKGRRFVDGKSENHGNWMRFVNHADEGERNLHAFEMDKHIWYVATEDIRRGVELKTDYGPGFASRLPKKPPAPVYDLSSVFACKKCSDAYSSEALLDAHVARRHPAEPKAALKQAVASSAEKRHRCSTCAYATNNIGDLHRHERVHTCERPFKCAVCLAAFAQAPDLERHSRTHTGERPFACIYCGKTFSDKSHLSRHRRLDEDVKLYKCEHCDERFTVSHHLTKHIRLHTGERPFVCTDCGKAFSDKSVLNSHRRIHEGMKAFKCDYCSKRFTQLANLTKHLRVHTGEKPYVCHFCPKSFSQSSNCRTHEKTQHPP